MTERDVLEEARELLARITPGPWTWVHDGEVLTSATGDVLWGRWYNDNTAGVYAEDGDRDFIAAAPDLVARLADALAESRAEVGRLRMISYGWRRAVRALDGGEQR